MLGNGMPIARLSLETFKKSPKLAEAPEPPDILLVKACTAGEVKSVGKESERTLQFVFSDGTVDHDNDDINPAGWDLKQFKRAGVMLWAHNAGLPPIAAPKDTWKGEGALRGIVSFTPPDMKHPLGKGFGHTIYRMYREGYMHAVSVGFKPLKWKVAEDRHGADDFFPPISFQKQMLLEISAVPLGSNLNALVEARSKGIDLRPLYDWAEMELDDHNCLVLSRNTIESYRDGLKGLCGKGDSVSVPAEDGSSAAPAEPTDGAEGSPQPDASSVPRQKGAISYASAHSDGTPKAPVDESWDGPAEIADAGVDALKVMCAYVEDGEEDVKGGYKLPHHKADDTHAVVWNGVAAAMGALLGSRGGVDVPEDERKGIYDHLAKHYGEFEKEAPEFKAPEPTASEVAASVVAMLKLLRDEPLPANLLRQLRAAALPFVKGDAEGEDQDEEEIEVEGVEDVAQYIQDKLSGMLESTDEN